MIVHLYMIVMLQAATSTTNEQSSDLVIKVVGIILAGVLVGFVCYAIVSRHGILLALANPDVARGLITFLIAFVTVLIAAFLVVASLTFHSNYIPDFQNRLTVGKEILAVMIGVLGTIVGFYYGTSVKGGAQPPQVAPAVIINETPNAGETTTIITFATGGKPPYVYSIAFDPPNTIPAIKDVVSQDGSIKQDVHIPDMAKSKTIKFQITISDSEGKSNTYKDDAKKISVKP
jgi:hypothetical protein